MDTAAFRASGEGGRIGPNAVLQLVPVLEARLGPIAAALVLAEAGLPRLPPDDGLMPEEPAHRLHRALRQALPGRAPALLAEAGARTGDYILAHRIPPLAQRALRVMPQALSARLLSRAIAKHAWTFAGSGRFTLDGTARFALAGNPLIRGEASAGPMCHWHVAVFERLFGALVAPGIRFRETACAGCGDPACRFERIG